MKDFVSLRIATLVLVAGYMLKTTSADADVTYLGVAAGDATTNDVIVWTRAKDEVNPQPTAINVQISTDPTFTTGVTTLLAGTAASPTDYTVKSNIGSLQSGTVYYYRFQTTDGLVTSNVGKFKTALNPTANAPVHFGFSGDCDGLIRPYALASQMPAKNLDFFMFDGDTEYETSASIGSPAVHSTGNIPDPTVIVATATQSQLFDDFSRKYREQFVPVNIGGQNCCNHSSPGRAITPPMTTTNSATNNTSMAALPPAEASAAPLGVHPSTFPLAQA
jgi:phosphodiesterase/alkaline phosphatase D-like protein